MEIGRNKIYSFAMRTVDPERLLEIVDVVFDNLQWAAQLKVAFSFLLKNVEDGSCRYSYAHEKKYTIGEI